MVGEKMKINFISTTEYSKNVFEYPTPATLSIPAWFKNMPALIKGQKSVGIGQGGVLASNTTLKSCTPFLDALSAGYVWTAPADIEIKKENGEYFFRWRVEPILISEHSADQHPGLPPAYNGKDFVLKWSFSYVITTPPGYSTFFTHPINRHDLPFRTFSGVVDTDKYPLPVQFPFQLIDKDIEDRIIIEEGTPLCQFFPIKREGWSSSKSSMSPEEVEKTGFNFKKKIVRAYKTRYWNKKSFT
jgi:hypothetical protein